MPGTVDYLKDKLMRAIDAEGNVLDISKVTEVVRDLEHIQLTAEDLTMTRLGRIVNSARRKMQDKSLARRMKKLVKQWQKLAAGLNGSTDERPSASNMSTPSPVKPVINMPTKTIIDVQPFKHQGLYSDHSNTKHLPVNDVLSSPSLDSKLMTAVPSSYSSASSHSTPLTLSSSHSPNALNTINSLIEPPLEQATPTDLHASHINGRNNNHLVISLPLKQISKHHEQQKTQAKEQQHKEQQQHDDSIHPTSLIVRVPLKFIRLPWGKCLTQPPPTPPPTELIVSVKLSILNRIGSNSTILTPSPVTTMADIPHKVEENLNEREMMVFDSSYVDKRVHLAAPSGRLKAPAEIPGHCVEGVDGCIGYDGFWHAWEDSIPSVGGDSVAILPYVYIDGLSGYDKEHTWSSLDTTELTSYLHPS